MGGMGMSDPLPANQRIGDEMSHTPTTDQIRAFAATLEELLHVRTRLEGKPYDQALIDDALGFMSDLISENAALRTALVAVTDAIDCNTFDVLDALELARSVLNPSTQGDLPAT